ncbi:MAG: hypothetical protein HY365_02440 [Candidatus Aenigmarchaeota archaeon]|nr:hypothetical protein [Candidatus Aenigmarchaeota archaeon]
MERISEELHSWSRSFVVSDIYAATGQFTQFALALGAEEKENVFRTTGPEKTTRAEFLVSEAMDNNTTLRVTLTAEGAHESAGSFLVLSARASLDSEFAASVGPAYETYILFYVSHVRQRMKELAEHSVDEIFAKLQDYAKRGFLVKAE